MKLGDEALAGEVRKLLQEHISKREGYYADLAKAKGQVPFVNMFLGSICSSHLTFFMCVRHTTLSCSCEVCPCALCKCHPSLA